MKTLRVKRAQRREDKRMPERPFSSRRSGLELADGANQYDHPGLALHRYLRLQDSKDEVRKLLTVIATSQATHPYRLAYNRWRNLQAADLLVHCFTATLARPMAVGLGSESVIETGLTTHHTYGMPLVPGSAWKGLLRRAARDLDRVGADTREREAFRALFGDTSAASFFVFQDAWYDPASADGRPFKEDVVTVHHPDYYGKRSDLSWPTDFDDPNPVPFIVVKPKAKFLFSVRCPSEEWRVYVAQMLEWALEHLGVGAKTGAGYGFFSDFQPLTTNGDGEADGTLWEGVTVTYNPGTGEIKGQTGDRSAIVLRPEADVILRRLPQWAQESLRDKKRKQLDVPANVKVMEAGGGKYTLTDIQVPARTDADRTPEKSDG